jgi:hypothetical protein
MVSLGLQVAASVSFGRSGPQSFEPGGANFIPPSLTHASELGSGMPTKSGPAVSGSEIELEPALQSYAIAGSWHRQTYLFIRRRTRRRLSAV